MYKMLKWVQTLLRKYKNAIYFLILVFLINYTFIFIALTVRRRHIIDYEGYQKYLEHKALQQHQNNKVKNNNIFLQRIFNEKVSYPTNYPTNYYKPLNEILADDISNKNMSHKKKLTNKLILKWSLDYLDEDNYLHNTDENIFVMNNCKYKNCVIIDRKDVVPINGVIHTRVYNAILFTRLDVCKTNPVLPKQRELFQKYIFASVSPAPFFPVTNPIFDDFFNWTWTYRLDSDILWRYITIHDLEKRVVGPSIDMKWKMDMEPIGEDIRSRLREKTKAAIVSLFRRLDIKSYYIDAVSKELDYLNCSLDKVDWNYKPPEEDYYFAFILEIVDDEDYVSGMILWALRYYTVPIVYGAVNYSRFLPPGSYLDANTYTPSELARTMSDIIQNTTAFDDYHRWRNYYSYVPSVWGNELCNLCEALSDTDKYLKTTTHKDFRAWWNGRGAN